MLVLSRKLNEKIVIDQRITVTVLEIRSGRVRLGIGAPDDVEIFREEIVRSGDGQWHPLGQPAAREV